MDYCGFVDEWMYTKTLDCKMDLFVMVLERDVVVESQLAAVADKILSVPWENEGLEVGRWVDTFAADETLLHRLCYFLK